MIGSVRAVTVANAASMNTIGVADGEVLGVGTAVGVGTIIAFVSEGNDESDAGKVAPLEVLSVPLFDPMKPQVGVRTAHAHQRRS